MNYEWRKSKKLIDILNDTLFVGNHTDDLSAELANNTWFISMSKAERKQYTTSKLVNFINTVINNRLGQLNASEVQHDMYFYLWHDKQACQLRFSLISDFHDKLPFAATVIHSELDTIVGGFLKSDELIPWSKLELSDANQENMWDEDVDNDYQLKVYVRHLIC